MILREFFESPLSERVHDIDHYNTPENLTESQPAGDVLAGFLRFACRHLKLKRLPPIEFFANLTPEAHPTFGHFDTETDQIHIGVAGRHPLDIMRTLAHELIHYKQRLNNQLNQLSGHTGSGAENQANAQAGIMMRQFADQNPDYFQLQEQQSAGKTLAEVTMDNQSGAGSTPNNADVDHLGLRVWMKPSVFLRLAPPLGHSLSLPGMRDLIQSGGAIGSPQLSLDIPAAWAAGDMTKTARVQSHEGRHRMQAILELEGDALVETHLFPLGMRRRNLTSEMIQRLRQSLISQGLNQRISGPVFELFQTDLAEHFKQQAKPGSGPGSLRRKAGKKKGEKITASDLERLQGRANRMKQSSDADTRRRGIQLARQTSWHENFH